MAGKVALPVTLPVSGTDYAAFLEGDSRRRQLNINGRACAVTGTYMASSFRLAGQATNPINLCTIEALGGINRGVAIRRMAVDVGASATTAYILQSYLRYFHNTGILPTGGVFPPKQIINSLYDEPSSMNIIVRFGIQSDGASIPLAITHPLPPRSPDREQAHPAQFALGVEQWQTIDYNLQTFDQEPMVLFPGQTGLLALTSANSATHLHYTVKLIWDEFIP